MDKREKLSDLDNNYITKNGRVIAKLTNPNQSRVNTARSLFGILPEDASLEDTKAERLNTK